MGGWEIVALILVVPVLGGLAFCAFGPSVMAHRRGEKQWPWLLMAFALGPLTILPWLAFRRQNRRSAPSPDVTAPRDHDRARVWIWRIVGGVVAFVLILTFLDAARGPSDQERARQEARLACQHKPGNSGSDDGAQIVYADVLRGYQEGARHAGEAASLDARWNALNTAMSNVVDFWAWATEAIPPWQEPPLPYNTQRQINDRMPPAQRAEATIRAECYKAEA